MSKEKNVIEFYMYCNKLKDVVRTGWKDWLVDRERVESIAEHVFGTMMLAIAVFSEYNYDIDIKKVLTMLAVHETEEILIGDFTPFNISKEEKENRGHLAVKKIFSTLNNASEIENLIYEFDERKTKEAVFAYFCDKLECDIQCKIYDEENCVDINDKSKFKLISIEEINRLFESTSWSNMWLTYDENHRNYDENFFNLVEYVKNNDIKDINK